MHPKSVLFMGTICPWAAILRTNGRSSHRSRVYRETRSAVPLHDANESTPRLRGHSCIRAGPRAGKHHIARVDDVHTHRVSTGEVRASSAPSPIETGSIKKKQEKNPASTSSRGTRRRDTKKNKKKTPPPPTRSSLGRDVTSTRRRHDARISFIHSVIHSFIHSGRGGESATRVTANERNGWVR